MYCSAIISHYVVGKYIKTGNEIQRIIVLIDVLDATICRKTG